MYLKRIQTIINIIFKPTKTVAMWLNLEIFNIYKGPARIETLKKSTYSMFLPPTFRMK